MRVPLGGERIHSGNKMIVETPEYGRSTHNLSTKIRTTMSVGTVVPFFSTFGLRGDTWTISMAADAVTPPTNGPLFGGLDWDLDFFVGDIRLTQGRLLNNALNVGKDMSKVKLPLVRLTADQPPLGSREINTAQISSSSIWKYALGLSGLGTAFGNGATTVTREMEASRWITYWDIIKNYYVNKQEPKAPVINNRVIERLVTSASVRHQISDWSDMPLAPALVQPPVDMAEIYEMQFNINKSPSTEEAPFLEDIIIQSNQGEFRFVDMFNTFNVTDNTSDWLVSAEDLKEQFKTGILLNYRYATPDEVTNIAWYDIEAIDRMREKIQQQPKATALLIDQSWEAPYGLACQKEAMREPQEGLALRAYKSDMFNNWMETESIVGDNGINEITAIQVVNDEISIDALIMQKKIYNMLNAIAVAGGSYYDWLDVQYEEHRFKPVTIPMYVGGLGKKIQFQEVISNAATADQPLGTLGGRGVLTNHHQGGFVKIKPNEHCIIMGLMSITPNIGYSQGNDPFINLKTMADFHVAAMDGIGWQDLTTGKMAWWEDKVRPNSVVEMQSAGKQPAWLDYQTNVDRNYGEFAAGESLDWMVLDRDYEKAFGVAEIADITTYIDPKKYNKIFADQTRAAMNFWVHIGLKIECRRIMSAKIMPHA